MRKTFLYQLPSSIWKWGKQNKKKEWLQLQILLVLPLKHNLRPSDVCCAESPTKTMVYQRFNQENDLSIHGLYVIDPVYNHAHY